MPNPLGPTNFFTYYMFHPRDKTLSETDSKIAFIASAALLLLTVGTVHALCYCLFYDRSVVQIKKKIWLNSMKEVGEAPHPTHPNIKIGVEVAGELPENVSIKILPLNESKTESDLSQYDFKLILNPKIPVDSPPKSYGSYAITLEGDAIKKMDIHRSFEVEILDTAGKIIVEGDGLYCLPKNSETCRKIAVFVEMMTTHAEYTFKFRYA